MVLPGVQRRFKLLLMLGVCALLLSSIPIRQAFADVTITQFIDNSVPEFTRGSFQRTSLGLLQKPDLRDQPGAVQLAPIGILKNWTQFSSNPLPQKLYRMGATAIGNRIYVIGGITPTPAGSKTISDVVSAQVSLTTGNIEADAASPTGWRSELSLPPVVGSSQVPNQIAPINSPAVASYAKSGGGGYIYVIGGNAQQGNLDFSSYAVRAATVGADGRITGWRELTNAQIPDSDGIVGPKTFNQHGLQAASAVMHTVNGKTFIYLLGGLERYLQGSGGGRSIESYGSSSVFYAEVNPGNGGLYKPSNPSQEGWDVLADSPIPVARDTSRADAGLWDSVATVGRFDPKPNSGVTATNAIYMMGGQVAPEIVGSEQGVYTGRVYQAYIQSDGKLTWTNWSGTMPEARFGHAGTLYRGTFYITGGIPNAPNNNEPDETMLTSYVDDNLTLPNFGSSNFLKSNVLPVRRVFHSTLLIQAGSGANSAAFFYILGGRGDTGDADPSDDAGSDQIAFSRIGGDEDRSFGYPPTGWYYSSVFPINFSNAQVREINWATQITRTVGLSPMDIEVDYRISRENTCDNPGFSDDTGTPTGWQPLDGDSGTAARSVNGQNIVEIGNLSARCFQYRARFTSGNGLEAASDTPSLLNLGIKIVLPGSPDLQVARANVLPGATNPAAFGGLDIAITNKNTAEETQPANIEGGGSFYVDLLVYEPGETPNLSPSLPLSGADEAHSKAFANVSKDVMTPNATVPLRNWCDSAVDGCQPYDITKVITKVGTYTFVVVVDSAGGPAPYVLVRETSPGGESNNIQAMTYNAPSDPANPGQPLPPEPNLPPIDGGGGGGLRILLPFISK